MTYIIPITELRKNIFALTERVARTGEAIEVEKEGKRIVKIISVIDDAAGKAEYVLAHVLPKLKRAWKHVSSKEILATKMWARGPREKRYWKRGIFS